MKKNKPVFTCIALLFAILFFSCKKEDTGGNFAMQIYYEGTSTVTIDIYASRSDMYHNSNRLFSGSTNGVAKVIIPGSKLENGKTYFIDAYTNNFSSHSLYSDVDSFVYTSDVPFMALATDSTIKDPKFIRSALSDNNQSITTHWKAIDILTIPRDSAAAASLPNSNTYKSIWNTLSNVNDRYKKLTFNKDFSGSYETMDLTGTISTQPFTYNVKNDTVNIPGIQTGSSISSNPTGEDVFYFPSVVDGKSVYYLLIKE